MAGYRVVPCNPTGGIRTGAAIMARDITDAYAAVRRIAGDANATIDATYGHADGRIVARVFSTSWWRTHAPCACDACAWHSFPGNRSNNEEK